MDQSRVVDYCMFAGDGTCGTRTPRCRGIAHAGDCGRRTDDARGQTAVCGVPVTRAAGREKGRDNQRSACAWAGISVMLCGRAVASSRLRESLPRGQGSNAGPADAGRAARRKVVRVGVAIAHHAQASAR